MDAGEIHTLQLAAFLAEGHRYADYAIPPLLETPEAAAERLRDGVVLKAVAGSRIVGSVQLTVDGPVGEIARLVVAPDWQGRGLGSRLLKAVEKLAPGEVTTFELFTGAASERNLAVYAKAGYRELRREAHSAAVDLVYLGKRRRRK